MAPNTVWYAGRCVKRHGHDIVANIEVLARKDATKWSLIEYPEKFFPKAGEVELRSPDAKSFRAGEWLYFQVFKNGRQTLWTAVQHHRLYRYIDFSHLDTMEEVHRILMVDGLKDAEQGGVWIARIPKGRIIKFELRRNNGVLLLAQGVAKIYAYDFEHTDLIEMPTGAGHINLYDLKPDAAPVSLYDWSPNADYIARVVRSIAGANDLRANEVIEWIEKYAKNASDKLLINDADLAAAHDALRSGQLAKQLAQDRALLHSFVLEVRAEPKAAKLLEVEFASLREEAKHVARLDAENKLAQELQETRRGKLAALHKELVAYEKDKRQEIEALLEKRRSETEEMLKAKVAHGQAEIDGYFASLKKKNELDLVDLVKEREDLENEAETLKKLIAELESQSADLRDKEIAALLELEQLSRIKKELEIGTSESGIRSVLPHEGTIRFALPLSHPVEGRKVSPAALRTTIQSCAVLNNKGKVLMEQFVALMLAGDVPALVGTQVSDFLCVAEFLLSSGVSARLEADPTIIAFEDLWVRTGTNVPTPLSQALDITSGDRPATLLAVIENAERSGARFWYPAIAHRARKGDLPRPMLLCVTIEDPECEEAKKLLSNAIWLEVDEVLAVGANVVAVAALAIENATELDPGERPKNIIAGMSATEGIAKNLSISAVLRAARTAVEAASLHGKANDSEAGAAVARLFLGTLPQTPQPKTMAAA